jgi:Domain of unknown function (DUF4157)
LATSQQIIRIKENAGIAFIAAICLRSQKMAVTIGSTIYLHGCGKAFFLANTSWVKHELTHVVQYKTLGYGRFLVQYFLQCLRYGYKKSPLELEAVAAETVEMDLSSFKFQ